MERFVCVCYYRGVNNIGHFEFALGDKSQFCQKYSCLDARNQQLPTYILSFLFIFVFYCNGETKYTIAMIKPLYKFPFNCHQS